MRVSVSVRFRRARSGTGDDPLAGLWERREKKPETNRSGSRVRRRRVGTNDTKKKKKIIIHVYREWSENGETEKKISDADETAEIKVVSIERTRASAVSAS